MPLIVSFEYGIYDLAVPDYFDRYTLSVTVPLGPDGTASRRDLFHDRGALTNILQIN